MEENKGLNLNPVLLIIPVVILIIFYVFFMDTTSPTNEDNVQKDTAEETQVTSDNNDNFDYSGGVTELKIEDIEVGDGKEAKSGDTVNVHYRGTLLNDKQFDSSYERGDTFSFTLGLGEVIKGWDQGVAGMKVGGKRKLTIPSDLGYGDTGAGADIPPGATLIFEVELVSID